MFVQKIPRIHQNVFSENSNVMVKLEIPDDIGSNDNSWPTDSLLFADVPVKQEDCISVLDSLDKTTYHNKGFIKPLQEDFKCQGNDHFTVEAILKNEVIESENCYGKVTIDEEFKDALKNEELFVGNEFKHEESVPSHDNVEVQKKTRTSKKIKRPRDCDDCDHGLEKKSRVPSHNKVVKHKIPTKDPITCKSQTSSKPRKSKSLLREKERKTKQEPSTEHKLKKGEYRCAHCDFTGRRDALIEHCRNKHPHIFSKNFVCCTDCGEKFPSKDEMRRHRYDCLPCWICKTCLVEVPTKKAMVKHMQIVHPEKIYLDEGGKILDEVCAPKTLDLMPFGQRYMEIKKFYMEIKSELIKLYCPKCAVTNDKIISRIVPYCDSCESRLLYQCQKCKGTQNHYSHIWRHLKSKNSYCSNYSSSSFMDQKESSNVMDQASKRHDCEICDFKGTTRSTLYEHVLNVHMEDGIIKSDFYTGSKFGDSSRAWNGRLNKLQDLRRIIASLPCRFCPTTYSDKKNLFDHIAIMHLDEMDGKEINEFLEEAADFTRTVTRMNVERFNAKLRNGTYETGMEDYHNGIKSMLRPVCIECKADGPHEPEYCGECQASLNFVCFKCDELFSEYSVAWVHATRICEKRGFTLAVGKTIGASTADKELLYCDLCSFKNTSKSILCNHIKYTHLKCQENQSLFTCPKCYRRLDNAGLLRQHRLRCRVGFHYKCHFCDQSSKNFHVIEDHMMTTHADHFDCKDTLDKIVQKVFENRRARTKKTANNNKFDEFGRRVRRTFSENVKLTMFYCPNCNETVHKNFRYVSDTSRCPKCNCKLRVYCKICNKGYFHWQPIAAHFQNTICGSVNIGSYDMDHSYCLRQPRYHMTKNSVDEVEI